MRFALPPLYPILDARLLPQEPEARAAFIKRTVGELVDAGVTLLQLRGKNATSEQVLRDAEAIRRAAPPTLRLILNDRADLLHETGFDGVHLGQGDLPVGEARARLGPDCVLGLSTHTPEQVVAGDQSEADYLAIGPVFETASKADAEPAVGLNGLREARARTAKPLVAIGGIGFAEARSVWAAGANSIAVIGALWPPNAGLEATQRGPGAIARDFLRLFR